MFSNKDLRRLLIPLIIEQLLAALMGTIDTLMVSRVGSAAISGVALVDSINKLIINLFAAMATGGTIICAQYLGHRDRDASDEAGRQLLLSSFILSLGITVFCFAACTWLLRVIFGQVEEAVMASAIAYFRITLLSYPFVALFNAGAALYRASGESKLPMFISVCCNVLNILGNALLIFVLRMGTAGAALATALAQAAAAVWILILLQRPNQAVHVGSYLALRPKAAMIRRVLTVGLPTGFENAMFQFGKLIVQSTVSTLGTVAIAANAIVASLEFLSSVPSMAIGLGLVTVAGQCFGAGKPEEAKTYIRRLTIWSAVVLFIFNWVLYFAAPLVTRAGGMEEDAARMALHILLIISIVKPVLWPLAFTPCNGTRAAGDLVYSVVVTVFSMWVLRVGLSTVLCRFFGFGLLGIWLGYFSDWTFRSILFGLRLRTDRWYRRRLIDFDT